MAEEVSNSLEYTPTWIIAVVCFIIVLTSLAAERGLHRLGKGKAQLVSLEALHQLHIFIFVLAVVYVVFSAATMILGGFKVRRWKHWEYSLHREISNSKSASNRITQIHARHRREFFKQRGGYSSILGVTMSFFKQFYGSVRKTDYIALRHGFIMTHCPGKPNYDFHKYMLRTLEYDFKKIAGISWYLWVFVVLFLLFNLEDEIEEKDKENKQVQNKPEGTGEKVYWVQPSDKHFWFENPSIFLYLIHFILFQNSFEIAFFLWVLFTYGIHSCILDKVGFIVPRLAIGVIVQVLCSYSTLPLYTVVTQMGSMFKQGIFEPEIHKLLETWAHDASSGRGPAGGLFCSNRVEMQNLAPELQEIVSIAEETTACIEEFTAP